MVRVVGIGAGGHAKVIMEILRAMGGWELVGLLDSNPNLSGATVLGVPIIGSEEQLAHLRSQAIDHVFIGIGDLGAGMARKARFDDIKRHALRIVSAIHPRSVVSPSATLGEGATIMAGTIINASTHLGDNVIANTGSIIEHDCVIGAHAHIGPGAALAGGVQVGEGSHVGIGASIRQGIRIGAGVIVAAGAVVVSDVPDNVVVAGTPARIMNNGKKGP